MRVFQINGSRGIAGVEPTERPDPVPKRGQILIRMHAASLNFRDLLVARGHYGVGIPEGVIPLSDGAGEVIAIGADVRRFAIGDRVCPTFSSSWIGGDMSAADLPMALGAHLDGVLSELVVCDEDFAVPIPNYLSYEQAACLPCAALTAWTALFGPRPVRPGETVLTIGSGGVSCFAIQFARAAGARIISTSSSDVKLELVRRLGAHETINYASTPEWEQEVLRLTQGRGADHVVEVGGGGTLPKSIASCAVSGQIHMIGVLTSGEINPLPLIRWRTLRGILVGSRTHFEAMNRTLEQHRIEPLIDSVFAFSDSVEAYRRIESGRHSGKVVIAFER